MFKAPSVEGAFLIPETPPLRDHGGGVL